MVDLDGWQRPALIAGLSPLAHAAFGGSLGGGEIGRSQQA